jgi:hypothetical protein
MKMLSKERTYINLSFGMVLYLLKGQSRHTIKLFHYQICNKLDAYHTIYSVSVPQSHSVYLKVMFQPTPKALDGMMLFPDGNRFTSPQFFSEDHNALNLRTIKKEHQDHFSERWAFCFLSSYWYSLTAPCRIIQLDILLVQRKLLSFAFYGENIIALCMNYYLVKAFFRKYANKIIRTIPAIESDGKFAQVNSLLLIQFQHGTEHISEYNWFGCVTSTLFTHRSDANRDDPITDLDSYSDDVLTLYNMVMVSREPAICKTYEFAHPVYDSIINTESNSHSGKSCRTFSHCIINEFLYFGQSSDEEQFPEMINTPGVDRVIDFVFINTESLNELVGGEYVKNMPVSQHQENLDRFFVTLFEVIVKKSLKIFDGFANLIIHINLLLGKLAFSYKTTYKEILFFVYCQGFSDTFLLYKELSENTFTYLFWIPVLAGMTSSAVVIPVKAGIHSVKFA